MENKIDIQALIGRLQSQIGAQAVKITILEMEIERLKKMSPQPPTVAAKERKTNG